ncbi:MAG: hypothetical protein IIA68_03025 [Proteobacteria bacterium]|nr:hypothetical protein [Pseudomonadota bacterium]
MATIGLVSCVSRKSPQAAEARDLYESALFKKARKYIEGRCDSWYILSAKFGSVDPYQVISPYEETLRTKPRAEREQWARRVWADLSTRLQAGDHIIILAGERYREYLVPRIIEFGCVLEVPMKGLAIGKQLQWLSKRIS